MFSKKQTSSAKASITFLPAKKTVEIKGFSTVLDVALGNKIDLSTLVVEWGVARPVG